MTAGEAEQIVREAFVAIEDEKFIAIDAARSALDFLVGELARQRDALWKFHNDDRRGTRCLPDEGPGAA